jgi:hypothetical protein
MTTAATTKVSSEFDDLVAPEPDRQRLFLVYRKSCVSDGDPHRPSQHELGESGQLVVGSKEGSDHRVSDVHMLQVWFWIHAC